MPRPVLCRRTLNDFGQPVKFCAKPIRTKHPLNWCDEDLAKLPFWPAYEKHIAPAVAATIAGRR